MYHELKYETELISLNFNSKVNENRLRKSPCFVLKYLLNLNDNDVFVFVFVDNINIYFCSAVLPVTTDMRELEGQ